eukprot:GEZU01021979.1.p1 GENE.GEZU01021979.1~~GEZU01021979.1.p1  ORF type:complete len:455 (-),score=170.74 GEZU01021979.1:125-1465(-)
MSETNEKNEALMLDEEDGTENMRSQDDDGAGEDQQEQEQENDREQEPIEAAPEEGYEETAAGSTEADEGQQASEPERGKKSRISQLKQKKRSRTAEDYDEEGEQQQQDDFDAAYDEYGAEYGADEEQAQVEQEGFTEDQEDASAGKQIPTENKPKDEFDEVLEEISMGKRRRSNKEADLVADEMADKEAFELVEQITAAYELDKKALRAGKPATNKLKLLPKLQEKIPKVYLQQKLIEHRLLDRLRDWLDFLPDGSLPNVNIRTAILALLAEFPVKGDTDRIRRKDDEFKGIEKHHLKESEIAKVVLRLSRHPQETSENQRVASKLIQKWSRLVFGLTSNYRNLAKYEDEIARRTLSAKKARGEGSSSSSRNEIITNPNRARIPARVDLEFVKRPEKKVAEAERKVSAPPPAQQRLAKKLAELKKPIKREGRAAKVAVEGKSKSLF